MLKISWKCILFSMLEWIKLSSRISNVSKCQQAHIIRTIIGAANFFHHTPFFSTHTEIHEILRILLNVRERSKPSAQIPKHQPLATLKAPRKSSRSQPTFQYSAAALPCLSKSEKPAFWKLEKLGLPSISLSGGPKSGGYEAFFIEREYEIMPKSSFSYCRSRPAPTNLLRRRK